MIQSQQKQPRGRTHQIQGSFFKYIYQLFHFGAGCENKVVIHPQNIFGGHLGDGKISTSKPTLERKGGEGKEK